MPAHPAWRCVCGGKNAGWNYTCMNCGRLREAHGIKGPTVDEAMRFADRAVSAAAMASRNPKEVPHGPQ